MTRVGTAVGLVTVALAFGGGALAYLVLPSVQMPDQTLFEAWCSALGVPKRWFAPAANGVQTHSSEVLLTHELTAAPSATDVGHGATLALRCTICHGPTGMSYANSPNLAGQYAAVTYKQLRDYRSGIRSSPIMTAMAQSLSDREMHQLAAYYASVPRPRATVSAADMPPIVRWGAPMRNIAPCGSCHGGVDHTMASPWLYGAPKEYLRAQLLAFAKGERINDINAQMRVMARGLTSAEIEQAVAYYAGDAQ